MPKSRKSKRRLKDAGHLSATEAEDLDSALAALSERAENDPKGLAADFVAMAWDEPDEELARTFALDALKMDPLCSDALLVLADLSDDDEQQLELTEAAVRMAEEALGDNPFEGFQARFATERRGESYIRARCELADLRATRGEWAQAAEHFWGLVDLWPGEDQGLRQDLIITLFAANDLDGIERLLRRYGDDRSSFWAYGWALASFQREGASLVANACLKTALSANRFVADYLSGKRSLPKTPPQDHAPGDRSEAQLVVGALGVAWLKTPGALEWLRKSRPAQS